MTYWRILGSVLELFCVFVVLLVLLFDLMLNGGRGFRLRSYRVNVRLKHGLILLILVLFLLDVSNRDAFVFVGISFF